MKARTVGASEFSTAQSSLSLAHEVRAETLSQLKNKDLFPLSLVIHWHQASVSLSETIRWGDNNSGRSLSSMVNGPNAEIRTA